MLDNDVPSATAQNVIMVGGPCANSVTAEWMGIPYAEKPTCYEDFTEGKAIVKLYEKNGYVGMVVAGFSADDTVRASKVVANHDDYEDFMGTEVEVTGTGTSNIQVSAPTVEEVVEETVEEVVEEDEE